MNQTKLQWKRLSNTSPYQIIFDKDNELFLQDIINHKITEFEIDNLPSNYIISFIQVLQNYIYYYLQNDIPNNTIFLQNIKIDNIEEKLSLKNEQIEELNKKLLDYQEILNKKDKLLNETNKKLYSLYNQYCKLENEYEYKINKYKNEMIKREENYEQMDDKLIDTFQYLSKLFIISNDGKVINNKKQNENFQNKLNTNRTLNNEYNKMKGNFNKQFPSNTNNNFRKVNTERNNKNNK